ncbi:MAG: hypothetical protein KA234_01110 [Saprospiraceae bacterium]|nr:hypothetical protein [Saprospiraceae bacterium]
MTQPNKKGRKVITDPAEKRVNIQCYMAPKDYVKMGRRQAAIMAATFIKQLNAMMEEGEPVILSPDTFKVVRSES